MSDCFCFLFMQQCRALPLDSLQLRLIRHRALFKVNTNFFIYSIVKCLAHSVFYNPFSGDRGSVNLKAAHSKTELRIRRNLIIKLKNHITEICESSKNKVFDQISAKNWKMSKLLQVHIYGFDIRCLSSMGIFLFSEFFLFLKTSAFSEYFLPFVKHAPYASYDYLNLSFDRLVPTLFGVLLVLRVGL